MATVSIQLRQFQIEIINSDNSISTISEIQYRELIDELLNIWSEWKSLPIVKQGES